MADNFYLLEIFRKMRKKSISDRIRTDNESSKIDLYFKKI